jgi:5-methylcytosine-specific restriction protein A
VPRARRVCSIPGCPQLTDRGQCADHRRQAEQTRGTAAQRGYRSRQHRLWRSAVLRRDPTCVLCQAAPSVHADHHPYSVRQLQALGIDPWADPARGRGLCQTCHSSETAKHQPGGWAAS